ncbi:MAG: hypothetical protein QNL91_13020 [Candidatus Krumholzibacteria bacterium]|nr:hypothetical protein [Candidatus Krumholzibacteria bacterium]
MKKKVTAESLIADLAAGAIVPLPEESWRELAPHFKLVSDTPTGLGGVILLMRRPLPTGRKQGWALVEDSQPGEKVVRPLASEKEARALIADRLAAYERMWDG